VKKNGLEKLIELKWKFVIQGMKFVGKHSIHITAIKEGMRFRSNQSTGGVPIRARKTDKRNNATTDCA